MAGPGLLVFLVDEAVDGNTNEWHPEVKLLQVGTLPLCIYTQHFEKLLGAQIQTGRATGRDRGVESKRETKGREWLRQELRRGWNKGENIYMCLRG